jgi:hypothetical protein
VVVAAAAAAGTAVGGRRVVTAVVMATVDPRAVGNRSLVGRNQAGSTFLVVVRSAEVVESMSVGLGRGLRVDGATAAGGKRSER